MFKLEAYAEEELSPVTKLSASLRGYLCHRVIYKQRDKLILWLENFFQDRDTLE